MKKPWFPLTLRGRLLMAVGGLVALSVLSSAVSILEMTEVKEGLDFTNRQVVPLGKSLIQLKSDSELLNRELVVSIQQIQHLTAHSQVTPAPEWAFEIVDGQVKRIRNLLVNGKGWADQESYTAWLRWSERLERSWLDLRSQSDSIFSRLAKGQIQNEGSAAGEKITEWKAAIHTFLQETELGVQDSERLIRRSFSKAEEQTEILRTGLQLILAVVILLSLILLWIGERTLRPLASLAKVARQISERGVRREDRREIGVEDLTREDELSQLGREFRRMTTSLLEREKTVESQTLRLEEQNRLLLEFVSLTKNILSSIDSAVIVTDLEWNVTHFNSRGLEFLEKSPKGPKGTSLFSNPDIQAFVRPGVPMIEARIEPTELRGKIYEGGLYLLRSEQGELQGALLVLQDRTAQFGLERRLQIAENLAAVGRLSAQVAHEVRNPLHSIGLEAEIAQDLIQLENLSGNDRFTLKSSIRSILESVDRLQAITDNYLSLSRIGSGKKSKVHLQEIIESVLATYALEFAEKKIDVKWKLGRAGPYDLDPQAFEQVIGNLIRNSIQSMERTGRREMNLELDQLENGKIILRIDDSGSGIPKGVQERLFQPFVTSKAQGTGLGLAFARQVVEQSRGQIRLVESVLGGACFEIELAGVGPPPFLRQVPSVSADSVVRK